MPMLGRAALAMWWDIAPEVRADFEDWHAHEHFPERLAIPGFRRASRWTEASGGPGVFVLYELENHDVLGSAAYQARLNAPTPWSTRLMPHHQRMVRSQCHVLRSCGAVTARFMLTVRLSPRDGSEEALASAIHQQADRSAGVLGIVGVHLLKHQAPPIAATREQQIRGNADRVADWVLLVAGYDRQCVEALASVTFSDDGLVAMGAEPDTERASFTLAYAALPGDLLGAPTAMRQRERMELSRPAASGAGASADER